MLGDVMLEILKRTLSLKGLQMVIDTLNLSGEIIDSIVAGFDFSIGYVLLIDDSRFLFTQNQGEYQIYEFSLIQFITQIRSSSNLGRFINTSLLEIYKPTDVIQLVFEVNTQNLLQVTESFPDDLFISAEARETIIGYQTMIENPSNGYPPDDISINPSSFTISDGFEQKIEQLENFRTMIENQAQNLVSVLLDKLRIQVNTIASSYDHRLNQISNSQFFDPNQLQLSIEAYLNDFDQLRQYIFSYCAALEANLRE
jgi:hypothetical protein